jgi:RimJ/RimL family protein N-acetyltransferase
MAWATHVTVDDSHAFLDFSRSQWEQHAMGPYLVERIDTAEVIGSSGFAAHDHRRAEIGYILARSQWGQGFASELVRALVDVATANGLHELYACVHPDNLASIRVLEKSGFETGACVGMRFPNFGTDGDVEAPRYALTLGDSVAVEQAHRAERHEVESS